MSVREAFYEELERREDLPKDMIVDFQVKGSDVEVQTKIKGTDKSVALIFKDPYVLRLAKLAKGEQLTLVESTLNREMIMRRLWNLETTLRGERKPYKEFVHEMCDLATDELLIELAESEKLEEERINNGLYKRLAIAELYNDLVKGFGPIPEENFQKVVSKYTMDEIAGFRTFISYGNCTPSMVKLFKTEEGIELLAYLPFIEIAGFEEYLE